MGITTFQITMSISAPSIWNTTPAEIRNSPSLCTFKTCGTPIAQLVELEIHNSGGTGLSPALGIVRQEPSVHPAVNGKERGQLSPPCALAAGVYAPKGVEKENRIYR